MDKLSPADRKRLCDLQRSKHNGSSADAEQDAATAAMDALRRKNGIRHSDLEATIAECLAAELAEYNKKHRQQNAAGPVPGQQPGKKKPDALTATHFLLKKYVGANEHEYVGLALWALHTHVFDLFNHTPRLIITSPEPACGKSNAFKILELLTFRPWVVGNPTAASLRNALHEGYAVFADEAEDLCEDRGAQQIIRLGFQKSARTGKSIIPISGKDYNVFGPLALGAIHRLGARLFPVTVLQRSLIIKLKKSLRTFDKLYLDDDEQTRQFDKTTGLIEDWAKPFQAREAQFNRSPEMPAAVLAGMRGGDEWLPLISIADSFGPVWGQRARDAAITFCSKAKSGRATQLMGLMDCEKVFKDTQWRSELLGVSDYPDGMHSADLVKALHELEGAEHPWAEYRGHKGDAREHKLTQLELAHMLEAYEIEPKKFRYPAGHPSGIKKPLNGYVWEHFKESWASHPNGTEQPEQPEPEPPEEPRQITKSKQKSKGKKI
jgi:hypothetical protein